MTPRPTLLLACLGWMTLLRFAQAVARERFSLVPLAPHVPMRSDCQRRVSPALKCPTGLAYISVSPKGLRFSHPSPLPTHSKAQGCSGMAFRFLFHWHGLRKQPHPQGSFTSGPALPCVRWVCFKLSYGPPLIKTIGDRNLYRLTVSPLDWTTPPRPPAKNKKIPRLD